MANYYKMNIQKVEKVWIPSLKKYKTRVNLVDKEFELKTYKLVYSFDTLKDRKIYISKRKPGMVKGNEILLRQYTNNKKETYTEVWANKTKYKRAMERKHGKS